MRRLGSLKKYDLETSSVFLIISIREEINGIRAKHFQEENRTNFYFLDQQVKIININYNFTHIAPFLSTGLESSADTLPLGGSDTRV